MINKILEDEIRQTFMSVTWSHKIQEKQAELCSKKYKIWEVVRIMCSALTTVGLFSLIFSNQLIVKIISAILSLTITFISMMFKSFNLQEMSGRHKSTANKLLIMRDKLRTLLVEIHLEMKDETVLLSNYKELQKELHEIYNEAPNTTEKAVNEARIALEIKKDNKFSDEEIDKNLPKNLRHGG